MERYKAAHTLGGLRIRGSARACRAHTGIVHTRSALASSSHPADTCTPAPPSALNKQDQPSSLLCVNTNHWPPETCALSLVGGGKNGGNAVCDNCENYPNNSSAYTYAGCGHMSDVSIAERCSSGTPALGFAGSPSWPSRCANARRCRMEQLLDAPSHQRGNVDDSHIRTPRHQRARRTRGCPSLATCC